MPNPKHEATGARVQFIKEENPKTITVIDSRFDGDIMVINEEDFDKKIHQRCNEHGQLVDARGVVLPEVAQAQKSSKPAPKE